MILYIFLIIYFTLLCVLWLYLFNKAKAINNHVTIYVVIARFLLVSSILFTGLLDYLNFQSASKICFLIITLILLLWSAFYKIKEPLITKMLRGMNIIIALILFIISLVILFSN